MSFEELLALARTGAPAARDELARRYLSRVDALLEERREQAAKVGARPSDITQESLLKAVQHLDHFRGTTEGEWWVWLSRIALNQATETYRRGNRQRRGASETVPLETEAMEVRSGARSPSQVTSHKEEWRHTLASFRWLEERQPNQHLALRMFHLEGESKEAIAEHMGRSVDAVESLMERGLRALRDYKAEESDPEVPVSAEVAAMRNAADAAFSKYLRRLERGEQVELEDFVKEHPGCAEELRGRLQWVERLRALAPSRKP
ncbi:sigma factor-like helix-turn-helix DNA-binding protein [Myxococcus fulvus]|uniref:sigma factor-like helix-turn-helix DNA-binding protein n=1 Tax=Myxococcus fulvus TaxID=33 RepID=UPI003BA071C0